MSEMIDIKEIAKKTIADEADAIQHLAEYIDDDFEVTHSKYRELKTIFNEDKGIFCDLILEDNNYIRFKEYSNGLYTYEFC